MILLWPRLGAEIEKKEECFHSAAKERKGEITRVGAALYLRCLINQVERTRHTRFLVASLFVLALLLLPVSPCWPKSLC